MIALRNALVAQLDRVLPSEGRGRGFESRRVRQIRQRPQEQSWGLLFLMPLDEGTRGAGLLRPRFRRLS